MRVIKFFDLCLRSDIYLIRKFSPDMSSWVSSISSRKPQSLAHSLTLAMLFIKVLHILRVNVQEQPFQMRKSISSLEYDMLLPQQEYYVFKLPNSLCKKTIHLSLPTRFQMCARRQTTRIHFIQRTPTATKIVFFSTFGNQL